MSPRELLTVEMKRTKLPNMILELRTERLRISRLRRVGTCYLRRSITLFRRVLFEAVSVSWSRSKVVPRVVDPVLIDFDR